MNINIAFTGYDDLAIAITIGYEDDDALMEYLHEDDEYWATAEELTVEQLLAEDLEYAPFDWADELDNDPYECYRHLNDDANFYYLSSRGV